MPAGSFPCPLTKIPPGIFQHFIKNIHRALLQSEEQKPRAGKNHGRLENQDSEKQHGVFREKSAYFTRRLRDTFESFMQKIECQGKLRDEYRGNPSVPVIADKNRQGYQRRGWAQKYDEF